MQMSGPLARSHAMDMVRELRKYEASGETDTEYLLNARDWARMLLEEIRGYTPADLAEEIRVAKALLGR